MWQQDETDPLARTPHCWDNIPNLLRTHVLCLRALEPTRPALPKLLQPTNTLPSTSARPGSTKAALDLPNDHVVPELDPQHDSAPTALFKHPQSPLTGMPVFCASSCTTSTGAPSPLFAFLPCGQAHPASTSFSTTSMWPTAAAIWAALPVFGSARLTSAPAAAWQAAHGSLSTPHEAAVHMRDYYDLHKDAQHADPLSQCRAHSRPNGTTQAS
jgi:hypothetical protein